VLSSFLRQFYSLLLSLLLGSCLLMYQSAQAMQLHATVVEPPQETPGVIYSLAQDQQDFLWLAAEFEGLLRFDGEQYLRFSPPGPRRAVSVSQVVSDQQNQLWIGTWGDGLWRLDSSRKDWRQVATIPADARIQALHLSTAQVLWIGTTKGLFFLRSGSMQAELWQPLNEQRIWHIAEQENGTLWVATSNGLYQLKPDAAIDSQWVTLEQFKDTEIRTLEIQGHQLLVGVRSRLFLLDITRPDLIQQIEFGNPNAIFAESASSWLVGSIDGMFRVRRLQTGLHTELLRPAIDVRRIFRDRRGQIWLASRNSGLAPLAPPPMRPVEPSLSQFVSPQQPHRLGPPSMTTTRWQALEKTLLQLNNGKWRELGFQAVNPVAYVRDVVEYGNHTLAATDQGLFRLHADSYFVQVPLNININRFNVERMAVAADGALWLGLWERGVIRIAATAATQEPSSWQAEQLQPGVHEQEGIVDIQTDAQQRLWLLTRQGKLYQGESDKITLRWQPDNALATGYFQCMLPVQNVLWLCTDRGLIRLNQDLTQTTILGEAEGLPDQRVIGITKTEHYVWVLTRNGVLNFKHDGSDLHLLATRPDLDLTSAQIKGISALADDQVQLATSSGIWQLSKADMTAVPAMMQLHLTSIRLNRQLFSIAEINSPILLPKTVEELQLQFRLLAFQPHLRVQYFFRWQGQQDWKALGQDAVLTLSQLSPGSHQLEVMAQAGGQSIKTQHVLLLVPVPFWQRPFGIILLSLLTGMLLWALYNLRTRRLQQRAATLDLLVAKRTAELEQANQQLKLLSNTDSLTGLLNRRALYDAAAMLQAQRSRTPSALTLILMDIDHFKKINDQCGHDAGDTVLKTVASYLKQRLRGQDLIARWGGEEFLLLMPQTDLPQAGQLIEQLRLGISALALADLPGSLSATFGISAVTLLPDALAQALKAADLALYQGKAQGRDQIVFADVPPGEQPRQNKPV
jgi:diguanylate cyclase (GGDEF)-like protein